VAPDVTTVSSSAPHVQGEIRVPGDKSISHRSLMLGVLASGRTRVRGILRSADVQSTASVLRALGADVPALADEMVIAGQGAPLLQASDGPLDSGNSGTTTRLMAGICAGLPFASTFVGDASLSRRPMRRLARPLEAMGARVELPPHGDGLPMTVHGGSLRAIDWPLEHSSAQIKSAILLAALVGRVDAVVRESLPTRDHTERMFHAFGVDVSSSNGTIRLRPTDRLTAVDVDVPGDPSSAAFFLALGALAGAGRLTMRGMLLNPTRTGFLRVLERMGAAVATSSVGDQSMEPVGDVVVEPAALRGTTIHGDEVPSLIDELPLVACLAARAEGETVVRGAQELRVKESDRIRAVVENLRAIGAEADELPDGWRVLGSRRPLSGRIVTHGDHRLAMAFGILGAAGDAELEIDNPDCVAVSYPTFWSDLRRVIA
jgi:3-phosphoshikimate 1-carboxyvinyltransferase